MRLIDADELFNWGEHKLSDATKYGNIDAEQQSWSYSTVMMYEVADEIEDAPNVDPVKAAGGCRCGECRYSTFDAEYGKRWCNRCTDCREINADGSGFCDQGKLREVQDDG